MTTTLPAFRLLLAIGAALIVTVPPSASRAQNVVVMVNGDPITDYDIEQRAALKALEGKPGTKGATEELINEALELQEAKRLNINITDSQVNDSFLQVARNLKLAPDKLTLVLTSNGISADNLKDRIRATLAWNQITSNVIMPRVQFSEADLTAEAQSKLTAANSYDYILKQVTFIGKGARTGDANRYRAQFKGCDTAVPLSEKFTDVAVTDIGRRHATQLPPAVATELGALPVGGISKPHTDQSGTVMLAVCEKEVAKDTTFITNQLRTTAGNDQLQQQQDKYLADLKAKAKIVRS